MTQVSCLLPDLRHDRSPTYYFVSRLKPSHSPFTVLDSSRNKGGMLTDNVAFWQRKDKDPLGWGDKNSTLEFLSCCSPLSPPAVLHSLCIWLGDSSLLIPATVAPHTVLGLCYFRKRHPDSTDVVWKMHITGKGIKMISKPIRAF